MFFIIPQLPLNINEQYLDQKSRFNFEDLQQIYSKLFVVSNILATLCNTSTALIVADWNSSSL